MAEAPTTNKPPRRVLGLRLFSLVAACWLLALITQLDTVLVPPVHDPANWLYMAGQMAHDRFPGRDLWDNKLPPIYLIGCAAVLTGAPLTFLWLIDSALTALAALAVGDLVRRQTDRAVGIAAAVLLILVAAIPSLRAGGYMTGVYAMPLSAVAVWLLFARARPSTAGHAGAAALWTLAVTLRPPLVFAAAALTILGLFRAKGRQLAAATLATLLGIIAATALVFAHPVYHGYVSACLAEAIYWPAGYPPHEPGPQSESLAERLHDHGETLLKLLWLHAAALAGLWHMRRRPPSGLALILWYLTALASVFTGWASFSHYHYITLAPTVALAALWLGALNLKARRIAAAVLLTIAALYATTQVGRRIIQAATSDRTAEHALVDYLREHVPPEQSVLFWVNGRDAGLRRRVDRPPGTRHFMAYSYLDMDMRLFREFLTNARPDWIVQSPDVPAPPLLVEQAQPGHPDIPALQTHWRPPATPYKPVATFGHFSVYQRESPRTQPAGR